RAGFAVLGTGRLHLRGDPLDLVHVVTARPAQSVSFEISGKSSVHRAAVPRPGTEPAPSKISGGQFVRSLSAAPISLRRGRVDQVGVRIKSVQNSSLVGLHGWFIPFQSIFIHKKETLHGSIMPPKPNAPQCRIKGPILVRKAKRHFSCPHRRRVPPPRTTFLL